MKSWKKGAVIGALWGSILGNLVYYLFGMFYWEVTPPIILQETLNFIIYLPMYLPMLLQLERRLYDAPFYMIFVLYGYNFLGWIIIGAVVGYLYGRREVH